MNPQKRIITLLETILRNGGYPIDFQFTAKDTEKIAAALEGTGFEFIEIGHGFERKQIKCELRYEQMEDQILELGTLSVA